MHFHFIIKMPQQLKTRGKEESPSVRRGVGVTGCELAGWCSHGIQWEYRAGTNVGHKSLSDDYLSK